jgi:hypothetical protein
MFARGCKSSREHIYFEEEDEEEDEDEEVDEEAEGEEKKGRRRRRRRKIWIRPAPRASGLRPQLDSVVFPPHMRSIKNKL